MLHYLHTVYSRTNNENITPILGLLFWGLLSFLATNSYSQCEFTIATLNRDLSCKLATSEVVFTDIASGLTVTGNSIIKASSTGWNTGAFSTDSVSNYGFAYTIINETNTSRMFGLNNNNTNHGYWDIDYAFYFQNNGTLSIYENGSNRGVFGNYSSGDTAKVAIEDGLVKYYLNSLLIYTSTISPTLPLYVDLSINTSGGTLEDITIANGTDGTFVAFASNPGTSPIYQWRLNGSPVGTNSPSYTNNSLTANDSISCDLTIGTGGCDTGTISSNGLIIKTISVNDIATIAIETSPTDSKCQKAFAEARFTDIAYTVSAVDNNLTKTGNTGWDGGAISTQTITNNGYAYAIVSQTNTSKMFGLNHNNSSGNYTDIDYAIHLNNNSAIAIYENGSYKGTFGVYSSGDTAKIVVEDSIVSYYLNNNILYTSSLPPSFPMFVDVSLNTAGSTLDDITLVSGTNGSFSAHVTNGGTNPTYQWKLNGTNVGTNSSTYTNSSLSANDVLTCEFIPDALGCSSTPVPSNNITYKITNPVANTSVYISATPTDSKCDKAFTEARFTNVSTDITVTNNNLVKTSGNNGWTSGANSVQTIGNNGYVFTIANETNTAKMFGLNSNNTTPGYWDIDYAFYLTNNGSVSIYENGSFIMSSGTYTTGDTIKVMVEDSNVHYYINSSLLYISTNTPTFPLFLDASLNTVGATLADITVVSGTDGNFTAYVTNGGPNPSYQWKLNGINVGSNSSSYSNSSLSANDTISCEIIADAPGCTVTPIASNNIIFKTINPSALTNVVISASSTDSKCNKAHAKARFENVSNGVESADNNLYKTGPSSWNTGANSKQTIGNNGFVYSIINETTTNRIFGLNNNNTSAGYTDIDFAIFIRSNGTLSIYENGSNKGAFGSYSSGDTVKVVAEDSTISYYINNHLLYTSSATPTFPLFMDATLVDSGSTLENIVVVSGTDGTFTAAVNNGGNTPSYQWKLNGISVGTNSASYINTSLNVGDVITCEVTADAPGCTVPVVVSNTITFQTAIPTENTTVLITTTPTDSKCQKASMEARFTNITSDITAYNNDLIKTGTSGWNSGANSKQTITNNGYVYTIANETNTIRYFGLNNQNTQSTYGDIDFAFSLRSNGRISIYENASFRGDFGTYTTGDTFLIAVEDSIVQYYVNSALIYTSSNAPTLPMFVDVTMYNQGSTLMNITLVDGTNGNFNALVTNGGTNPTYQWKLNGTNVGTNSPTYSNSSLSANDTIICEVTADAPGCSVSTTVSNSISYKMEDPTANTSVVISAITTDSKCEKAHTQARFTNVSANITTLGNNLIKTGNNGWNGNANSIQTISNNGYAYVIANETNTAKMFGLNNNNTSSGYWDIDYALYLSNNNSVSIYENGSFITSAGTYSTGDTAKVLVEDSVVYYYINSHLLYTSLATPSLPLFADFSLYTTGTSLSNVTIVSGTGGTFSASVNNGGPSPNYQWKLNGSNVGTNSPTYTNTSLSDSDIVECEVISDAPGCTVTPVSSNSIMYKTADPIARTSVAITAIPTESKCNKAYAEARFTNISSNLNVTGNNIVKTGFSGWNAGINSVQSISNNGYIFTIVNETNTARMFGLNHSNTSSGYGDIDFALYLQNNGTISIFESGSYKGSFGSYASGDTAKVLAEDSTIYYYINSSLIYTSYTNPTFPLFVDASFNTVGATLDSIVLVSGTDGNFMAMATNGGPNPSYQWKLNGTNVGANSAFYSNSSLAENDVITCEIIADAPGCTVSPIPSNTIEYRLANATENTSVSISAIPTATLCQKVEAKASFTNTSGNIIVTGNNLVKNGADGWNSGANSDQTLVNNGYAFTVINEDTTRRMFGLSNTNTTAGYGDIDFAVYLTNNGYFRIYESGSYRGSFGSYTSGDTVKLVANNHTIYYYLNSTLLYTSNITPTFPLFVDVSLYTNGATLENIHVVSGMDGIFEASVVNAGSSPTYQWKLNGINVGTNSATYSNHTLNSGDTITCVVTPDSADCFISDVSSNIITVKESNCIVWDSGSFTGGSHPSGAPNYSDSLKTLFVLDSAAVIPVSAYVQRMVVTTFGNFLTIPSGKSLSVKDDIVNNGSVIVDNGASLVQYTSESDTNSGTGFYHVYQTGTFNNMVYNVWSSPIQEADIIYTFDGANPCDIYAFEASSQTFKYDYASGFSTTCAGNSVTFQSNHVIAGGDGIADVARGYFIPNGWNAEKTFSGNVNNGEIHFPVVITDVVTDTAWNGNDWNLIGNPYPSGLNATAFWNENAVNNSRITDALYFWDNDDYATWNLSGGVPNGTGETPDGIIGVAQGFFVAAVTNNNVVINNQMRDTTNNQFFKTEQEKHNVWVTLTGPSGANNHILIGFNSNATKEFDPVYDARRLNGSSPVRISSILNDKKLVIQSFGLSDYHQQLVVPLSIYTQENGIHTFSELKRENMDDNVVVYLHDKQSNSLYDLRQNVEVLLKSNSETNHRFELVFVNNNSTTSVNETHINEFTLLSNESGLSLLNSNGILGDVQLLDVTGKVVWKTSNVNSTRVDIRMENLSSGVYFIHITHQGERVYINKVVRN